MNLASCISLLSLTEMRPHRGVGLFLFRAQVPAHWAPKAYLHGISLVSSAESDSPMAPGGPHTSTAVSPPISVATANAMSSGLNPVVTDFVADAKGNALLCNLLPGGGQG